MPRSIQLNLPPVPVQRLESRPEAAVQKLDLTLEDAKAQVGGAVRKAITKADAVLKDFGDPSHVKRVCDGDIPSVLARVWQQEKTRREFVLALAEESGLAYVEVTVRMRRSA